MVENKDKAEKVEEILEHEEKRIDSWEFFWGRRPASLEEEVEEE